MRLNQDKDPTTAAVEEPRSVTRLPLSQGWNWTHGLHSQCSRLEHSHLICNSEVREHISWFSDAWCSYMACHVQYTCIASSPGFPFQILSHSFWFFLQNCKTNTCGTESLGLRQHMYLLMYTWPHVHCSLHHSPPLCFRSLSNFIKVNIGDGGRGMNVSFVVEVGQGGEIKIKQGWKAGGFIREGVEGNTHHTVVESGSENIDPHDWWESVVWHQDGTSAKLEGIHQENSTLQGKVISLSAFSHV